MVNPSLSLCSRILCLTCRVLLAGLKTYFEQFGPVTHCTIMRDGETQRSRGFAFLTFAQASSVNAVMTREHYLDGKTVSLTFRILLRES